MRLPLPGAAALLTLAITACAPRAPQRSVGEARATDVVVPTPAAALGYEPGADRRLPRWTQIVDYFQQLDAASPRVTVRTLGQTTLGRPFIAAFIGDSATLADLDALREIQRQLADPRTRAPGARDQLVAHGKVVALVTSSIHSTEVGGFLTPLVLAHRLATAEDAEARRVRDSTLVVLVPSLNPDGVDIVGEWYQATLGTPYEGSSPPRLYHHYTGHDNNRDWYAFTQVETRLTIDSLHNVWHPQIVNDIHQQGPNGSRIFIPPYLAPVEPNVDPLLIGALDSLGHAMARRLTKDGKPGVVTDAIYDAWTPARAYQHYHGGVRILTETASADLATPVTVPFDSLRGGHGYDARVASANFPVPWRGGRWTLGDIVDYQTSATWAMLVEASGARTRWLDRFATLGERAVAGRDAAGRGDWPIAFVIPMQQPDQAPLRAMLRILQRGQVEVRRAMMPFASGNVRYSAGTYVVFTAQPYGAFAKALLETQAYPDLRDASGAPRRPYDVTAHTLPLLMGVGVGVIRDSFPVPVTKPIAMVDEPRLVAPGLSEGVSGARAPRIALHRSYAHDMDEGWTRWVLDQYHIPYTSVVDRDVRAGALRERFDAIVLTDKPAAQLARGPRGESYPDSLVGGLGEAGAAALETFVREGGTLVAFNEASGYAIQALRLPVRDVLAGVSAKEFYGPGSLLRVDLRQGHPLRRFMVAKPAVWFEGGPAFEITDSTRAAAVATYPTSEPPLLSGWLLGGERLHGRAALVEVRHGKGRVVLFGFRPQYRGQSMATYPLIWAALLGDEAAGRSTGRSDPSARLPD